MGNITYIPFKREHLGEMTERLFEVVYSYSDRISTAEALGVLDIVKTQILNNKISVDCLLD